MIGRDESSAAHCGMDMDLQRLNTEAPMFAQCKTSNVLSSSPRVLSIIAEGQACAIVSKCSI